VNPEADKQRRRRVVLVKLFALVGVVHAHAEDFSGCSITGKKVMALIGTSTASFR
jgi:hypothetical protein